MNSMPHSLQMYGRMSLCFIMWFCSWLGYWKVFWHSEHLQAHRVSVNGELTKVKVKDPDEHFDRCQEINKIDVGKEIVKM